MLWFYFTNRKKLKTYAMGFFFRDEEFSVSAHINVENFRLILLITGVVIKLTRQVPLVEQELLSLLEHLRSPSF